MTFIEKMKALVTSGETQEETVSILENIIDTLLGNPIAAGKAAIALAKTPVFIRDQLFWRKISAFLNGVYLDETDCAKLAAKLTENGKNKDNPLRLLACIEQADTQKKIEYLINATRSLLAGYIDLPTYFRICHAVTHTIEEDLKFLREHIWEEKTFPYSVHIQGLITTGLVHIAVIGDNEYVFVPIAKLVDRFAVSFNDVERYPNPIAELVDDTKKSSDQMMDILSQNKPKTVLSLEAMEPVTAKDEDVDEILNKYFPDAGK